MGISADETKRLTAPLISQPTTSTGDVDASDEAETSKADLSLWPVAGTALLAAGGLATSVAAMMTVPTVSVYVAGVVCVVTSPWVAANQIRMFVHGGVGQAEVTKRTKSQLESLRKNLHILEASVHDLTEEVQWLQESEQKLDDIIAREQEANWDEIISLVRENELILSEIRNCLRDTALADVTKLILASDTIGNMTICLDELNGLTTKIWLQLAADGIDLDEGKFKAVVRTDNEISYVLQVIAATMFEELVGGQDPDEYSDLPLTRTAACIRRLRSNQDDVPSSQAPATPVGRSRRRRSSAEDGGKDAPTPMFSLQETYTKGSVASARGRKTSLSKKIKRQSSGEMMRGMIQEAIDQINADDEEEEEASSATEQDAEGKAVDFETDTMTSTVQE